MFSGCTVLPDRKETKLGSSDREAPPSTGKNTGAVLLSCHTWKCVPTAISSGVDIFMGVICYNKLVFSEGHKTYF